MSIEDFVRKTRPSIAHRSFWLTALYVLGTSFGQATGHGGGPDFAVIGAVFSPCLSYMAARTMDKRAPNA